MAQWMSLVLLVVATTIVVTESRAIPAEPMMLDPYGNPIVFLREKRTPAQPYPHRAMMFTSYYRPVRRSNHGEATGVFAQGNAVSGEAFFGGMQTPHLSNGPEPIEDQKFSSAEAQAAPGPDEPYDEEEPGQDGYQPEGHHRQEGHPPQEEPQYPQNEQNPQEDEQNHRNQGVLPPQEQPEPQPVPAFTPEGAPGTPADEPVYPSTEASANRPKGHHGKKNKKTPVVVDDDEEDDEDEDELSVPFAPPFNKGNRRRQNYPNLNNFFPMMFSFRGANTRSGSSGSPPGAITAIANSYSTAKGGVASSVATAYGGSPNGKKRRTPSSEE